MTLLKGKEQARLLIGSMNLSKSSFSGLKEVCYSIDIDYSSTLYKAVVDYLRKLPLELSKHHWVSILDELSIISRNKTVTDKTPQASFISNIEEESSIAQSFLKQVDLNVA
ncbi:MAG: hypothetical protein M1508_09980 [Nitrospirae bacterium]|nr:hypothetical protein [Nitrospirota bacterium]